MLQGWLSRHEELVEKLVRFLKVATEELVEKLVRLLR